VKERMVQMLITSLKTVVGKMRKSRVYLLKDS